MKYVLSALLTGFLLSSASVAETVSLGDWGRMTAPESYQTGVAFPVEVEILKQDAPTKLVLSANWMKPGGKFGGFLQGLGAPKEISEPGTYRFNVTIKKTMPDLVSASLTAYLSPDGTWPNKTQSGFKNVPLVKTAQTASVPSAPAKMVEHPLADWGKITVPDSYQTGEAFPVKVDILKLDGSTRLVVSANS